MRVGINIGITRGLGNSLAANPPSSLNPALLRVGDTIGSAYVAGTYTYNGQAVTLGTPAYTVNGGSVAASYVLQTGDLVAAATVPATVGALNVGPVYAEPTTIWDFNYTAPDLEWQVPPGAGDTTAPILSSPTGTATGQTTADGFVTTDEANGTLYMVTTTSATQPTKAQVKAGQNHTGAAAAFAANAAISVVGIQGFSITGLTAGTGYYNHYMHEDTATNQSNVSSSALFTTTAAGSAPTLVQTVMTLSSTATASQREGASITIGSGSNRLLVALIPFISASNTDNHSGTTVTFGTASRAYGTGTAMTILGTVGTTGSNRRPRAVIAALASPATGAGTVQVEFKDAALTLAITPAAIMWCEEWTGADQVLGNHITAGINGTAVTSRSTSITTIANNSVLATIVSILSGNYTAEIAATGGATLNDTECTGTTAASDLTAGLCEETVATAGADGSGFSWTTAADAAAITVAVAPA